MVKGRALARPSERSERFEPLVRGNREVRTPPRNQSQSLLVAPLIKLMLFGQNLHIHPHSRAGVRRILPIQGGIMQL